MSKSPSDRKQAGGFAAPIVIDSAANAERVDKAKRVAIFELDGEAVTMSAAVRAEVGLTYLKLKETEGEDAASYYLLTECLGVDAYDRLMAVKGLTGDQLEGITLRVTDIALPKGKAPTGVKSAG